MEGKKHLFEQEKVGEGCDVGGTGPGSALIVARKDREAGFTKAKPQLRTHTAVQANGGRWRAHCLGAL